MERGYGVQRDTVNIKMKYVKKLYKVAENIKTG